MAALSVSSAVYATSASAGENGARRTIADTRPTSAGADRGPVAAGTRVDARVYLTGRDPAGLASYAASVSDPRSENYGRYLTPAEVDARFGATPAQLSAVRSWLTSAGLSVTRATSQYLRVSGDAAATGRAFGIALRRFTAPATGGRPATTFVAPDRDVTAPASVAGDVLSVVGLDTRASARTASDLSTPPSIVVRPQPCSRYWGEKTATDKPPAFAAAAPYVPCGYTPEQIRSGYGLNNLPVDGTGSRVAVVLAYNSPTALPDANRAATEHGLPAFRDGQYSTSLPDEPYTRFDDCGGADAWYVEQAIDVETVHTVAPGAQVLFSSAASCGDPDLLDAEERVVEAHSADMISNSWTFGPTSIVNPATKPAFDRVFQRAAVEGIGVYFVSGDFGPDNPASPSTDFGQPDPTTEYPAENPNVTAVGGTTLAIDGNGRKLFQASWGGLASTLTADGTGWTPAPGTGYPDNFLSGGGGGTSPNYRQPAYQADVVPTSLSTRLLTGKPIAPSRVVPDVAMDAANETGMAIGETMVTPEGKAVYTEVRWGGTSLATPMFVGVQALSQQAAKHPLGFANPALYQRYQRSPGLFDDVTDTPLGPNTSFGVVRVDYTDPADPSSPIRTRFVTLAHDGLLHATAGYDNATGLGTVGGDYVRSYLPVGSGS
jgi:subtilase family serine protease